MTEYTTDSQGLDFVTYAADNYAHWVEYWLKSASRSNPESRLWVYDVSATPSDTLSRLVDRYPNAECIAWPEARWSTPKWVATTDFRFFWPGFNWRDQVKYLSRLLRFKLTGRAKHDWMIDKKKFTTGKQWFIGLSCVKPHIIGDAMARGNRPLAFVDADAVVLERFAGYPGGATDMAVTVVEPDQVRIGGRWEPSGPDGPLPVKLVNAGVVFMNRSVGASRIIDTWISEMARVHHGSGDQTALANLLYRHDPFFFETRRPVELELASQTARVASLPCSRYNQVRIARDESGIPADAAIAHFVGSWKQPDHWRQVGDLIRQAWRARQLPVEDQQ